jgi:hypothetical protein
MAATDPIIVTTSENPERFRVTVEFEKPFVCARPHVMQTLLALVRGLETLLAAVNEDGRQRGRA